MAESPGERIKGWLKAHKMTQTEMARRMGVSLKHLNQLISGKASLTYDMAQKLEQQTGITATHWNVLEAVYRTELHAQRSGQHPATGAMLLREAVASARMDRDQTINLGAPVTNYAVAPGEYIAEWLQEEEVSHAELEYALGVPETYLDALLSGQIALSDDVARALERLTGIPVTSWQRLDAKYWQDKARLAAADD